MNDIQNKINEIYKEIYNQQTNDNADFDGKGGEA